MNFTQHNENPWIIFVEGLPGSGKSTFSKKLSNSLRCPHSHYEENCHDNPVGLPWSSVEAKQTIINTRINKYPFGGWNELAAKRKNFVLESRLLQNTALFAMLNGSPEEDWPEFSNRILNYLKGFNVGLILLHQSDPAHHINRTLASRNVSHPTWRSFIEKLFIELPWSQNRKYTGIDAFTESMVKWSKYQLQLVENLNIPKIIIVDPWKDWQQSEDRILKFSLDSVIGHQCNR